ncbi:hypothetical protein FDK38_000077 [Candidozyma auris]|nr:hypothetical protein FDK38_000077 [[Candida] auris]
MENVEHVRDLVTSLQSSIEELQGTLQPITDRPLDELIRECGSPKEEAEFLNNYLYCTVSLIFAYLKIQGINTDEHPIMKELDRAKASMKRLKEMDNAEKKKEEKDARSNEKAAEYIQRTLGGVSGGQAASENMKSPAISASNFQGKHTKFTDMDDDSEPDINPEATRSEPLAKPQQSKTHKYQESPQNKISKPKSKGKRLRHKKSKNNN